MFCFIGLLIFLLLPLPALAQGVSYSAIVLDISGKATVTHQGSARLLELGVLLYPQEVVETAPGASLTINYLESGEEEQWPGEMKFAVGQVQSEPLHPLVKKTNRKVALPTLAFPPGGARMVDTPEGAPPGGLRFRGGPQELEPETMEVADLPGGAAKKFRETVPQALGVKGLSNSATLEDRPTFSWEAVSGAETYRVALYPPGGKKPAWEQTSPATVLPFPPGKPSLLQGRRYVWEVEARKDGQVIAKRRSCFSLPDAQEIASLHQQMQKFTRPLAQRPGDTPTRLAFIFFLEDHRLYDEAAAQYALLRSGGKDSDTLRNREEGLKRIRLAPCDLGP